jgi:hypothetical protein
MPTRAQTIVICSCGVKWGNLERAALFDEAADVERVLVASYVPRMVRHWQLGHTLGLGENAPWEYLGVVASVAERMRAERDASAPPPEADSPSRLALVAMDD